MTVEHYPGEKRIAYPTLEPLDSFGRVRGSNPFALFDAQFNYGLQPSLFEQVVTGGSVTHIPLSSAVRLSTGGTVSGNSAVLQTKQYFRYLPGKSQQIVWTCVLGEKVNNVRKTIGLLDSGDGLGFMQDNSGLNVLRRTSTSGSVVDNIVPQSEWNIDKLDGTGESSITLDVTKNNIYIIDFQWLGAGRIRYGFDFGGHITYAHKIQFANTEPFPFMRTANLPFRAEITNTATADDIAMFDFTCTAVSSEGGAKPIGILRSISNGVTERTVSSTPLPLLSIKSADTFNGITNRTTAELLNYEIYSLSENIYYEIILNGNLTGAVFNPVTDSTMDYDTAATAISGGSVIDSGFITGALAPKEAGIARRMLASKLTQNIAGDSGDILSIVCTIMSAGNTDCSGVLTWEEIR